MKRKPFDDIRVRQALRYAIDVNSIAKDLFGGLADPIQSFLPPFMFGYSAEITRFDYNPDKARQMLKDANVPPDWNPDVIGDGSSAAARKVHEAVGSFWNDVGVKAKIEMLDSGSFQQRRSAGDYDIFGISVTRIDPDQIATPYWHTGSTVNNSFYAGADALIDQAKAEPDPTKRAELYRQLQDRISQDSPAAFTVAYSDHLLVNKRVGGISGDGWQDRFDWFNVDVPAE
jgi:dipeptide transport system substrate-binding protein